MTDLNDLKRAISEVVKTNYNKEITGAKLQDLLIYIVNQLYGNDAELIQAIDSIEIGGVRLKSEFGQSQIHGLTQKFLTEVIGQLQQNINIESENQNVINAELREGIAAAGKVDDVQVDGLSVLDPQTKIANITIPSPITVEGETLIF